jgi:hypothetical protein
MINEMTRIYPAESKQFNEVEASIYYERGCGYVYRIVPRNRDGHGYMYILGFGWTSGYRVMVLPCTRQSKKRYEEAVAQITALEDEYIHKLEESSGGNLKVKSYEFTQSERDRYAAA